MVRTNAALTVETTHRAGTMNAWNPRKFSQQQIHSHEVDLHRHSRYPALSDRHAGGWVRGGAIVRTTRMCRYEMRRGGAAHSRPSNIRHRQTTSYIDSPLNVVANRVCKCLHHEHKTNANQVSLFLLSSFHFQPIPPACSAQVDVWSSRCDPSRPRLGHITMPCFL